METKKEMHEAILKDLMASTKNTRFNASGEMPCWDPECDGVVKYLPEPIPTTEIEEIGPTKIVTNFLTYARCPKCGKGFKVENEFARWRRTRTKRLSLEVRARKAEVERRRRDLQHAKALLTNAKQSLKFARTRRREWIHTPLGRVK